MSKFEMFLETKYLNVFKIFRETFTYTLCPKKFFLQALISKIHEIHSKLTKMTIYIFCIRLQNFATKTIVN